MSRSTPFLIGNGAGGEVASMSLDAGEGARSSLSPNGPSPGEQAVATAVFRKSRREGFSVDIDTSEGPAKHPRCNAHSHPAGSAARIISEKTRDPESRLQRNLFRSILGSHASRDFSVSSQLTSRPEYAAVRAIMQESADSAPLSA